MLLTNLELHSCPTFHFLYLCYQIWSNSCIYEYSHALHVWEYVHACGSHRLLSTVILQAAVHLVSCDKGLHRHWSSPTRLNWLANEPWGSSVSTSRALGLQAWTAMIGSYIFIFTVSSGAQTQVPIGFKTNIGQTHNLLSSGPTYIL